MARIRVILDRLAEAYPEARCTLDHGGPFELLIATILAAQCTDRRVNQVTPGLFARYPDAQALATADPDELREMIRSTGFFRNKAKALIGSSRRIVEAFDGEVPRTMEALLGLPGVARKTANVVLGVGYGIPSGIVVDTHVKRVTRRIGLTRNTDPVRVERDLCRQIPGERWIDFPHQVIAHGRKICAARAPRCDACPLEEVCRKVTVR